MQNDNSSDESTTMKDILAQAQEAAQAIEKIKQESSASALDVAQSQTKASSELSTIITAHEKLKKTLEFIKEHGDAALKEYEEIQVKAAAIKQLSINSVNYEKNASAAETSSKNTETKINAILDEVKESQNTASSFAVSAKTINAEIQAILGQVTTKRDEVLNLHDKAKIDSKNIEGISKAAKEADDRVLKYERELAQLQERFSEVNDRIEKLLPGATSVGLAKAFNERKESLKSQVNWARALFLGAIAGFLLLGFYGLKVEKITTISQFFIFVFERSPIVVGLVLLEEFGRRLYSHTLRLEEDYAYKETISLSFDGYKQALAEIDKNEAIKAAGGSETLTKTLSSNVLGALNERPGRIYDEKEKGINIDTVLKTLNPTGDETTGKVFLKLYGDLRQSFKGSVLKAVIVIVLVAAFGIGAGYYFGYSNKKEVNVGHGSGLTNRLSQNETSHP